MSLLELAQEVDRLAKQYNRSEVDIMRHALDRFELVEMMGSNLAERELLFTTIEILHKKGKEFARHYHGLLNEHRVVDEAKQWRRSQITGQSYSIATLARAVDAQLVDDPELSALDRDHLKRLQAREVVLKELEEKVVEAAVAMRELQETDPKAGERMLTCAVDELIKTRNTLPSAEPEPSVHAQDYYRESEG